MAGMEAFFAAANIPPFFETDTRKIAIITIRPPEIYESLVIYMYFGTRLLNKSAQGVSMKRIGSGSTICTEKPACDAIMKQSEY